MTGPQQGALLSLELAFARCADAGLGFVGMDDTLLACEAAAIRTAVDAGTSVYDVLRGLGGGTPVDTHKTYLDSGGW